MANNKAQVSVQIVITNPKVEKAMEQACELAEELASDLPWNDTAKRLLKRIRYLANNLEVVTTETD